MKLLEAVERVARKAGAEALARFRSNLQVETKADGTPVTEADRAAERAARAVIAELFPQDGVVGEELGESNPGAKRRWFVDPIDGTKAFVRGVPLWGTLVAVTEGEEVLAGAMFFPALDECIAAEQGEGCFWNSKPARVSTTATLGAATVLTTDARAQPPTLMELLRQGQVCRTWGDCYGYLLVATGRADVMVDPVLSPWDSAALKPIIEEAGGVFQALDGRRTAFGGSAVATNAALAKEVMGVLRPARREEVKGPSDLDFTKGQGKVDVVTQDARTGEVLMVAHADAEAVAKTIATQEMHYTSRTRGLWHKGATSGNVQRVVSLSTDCDRDALLAQVVPQGPACHEGTRSCFASAPAPDALSALDRTIAERAKSPGDGKSYTQKLLADENLRLKKLGEETAELLMALTRRDVPRAAEEAADLVYHALVALRGVGVGLDEVRSVLAGRAKKP
jgi:histidinol phosphatase-like enzyme (inositol monophosphatase family)